MTPKTKRRKRSISHPNRQDAPATHDFTPKGFVVDPGCQEIEDPERYFGIVEVQHTTQGGNGKVARLRKGK